MRSWQALIARQFFTRVYPFRRGHGRILTRTWLGKLDLGSEPLTTTALEGFRIDVYPNDLIGRHILLTGQFDRTVVEVLCRFAQVGDTLLDIGANIGYQSAAEVDFGRISRGRATDVISEHCAASHR